MSYLSVPVSNFDSDSVKSSPVEYLTNLALVYLLTKSGPQGPKPLRKNTCRKILNIDSFIKTKVQCNTKMLILKE